jgi:hypothetical protein
MVSKGNLEVSGAIYYYYCLLSINSVVGTYY